MSVGNCTVARVGLLLIALGLTPTLWSAEAQAPRTRIQLVDRIVAVVNNEVITQNELQQQVDASIGELRSEEHTSELQSH